VPYEKEEKGSVVSPLFTVKPYGEIQIRMWQSVVA
jgi:hypothetical protein